MPLPAPLVGLTVRAKLLNADSTPLVGSVTLTPTLPAQSPAGDVLLSTVPLTRTIGADGSVEWTNVLATDSPGLSNRVPYLLHVAATGHSRIELVELLSSQAVAGVLRLDDVTPATPAPALVSYLTAASLGQIGGPAGPLDATGKVPAGQLPATGGGIPASIVDAVGDLIVASAADTVTRLPVGTTGQVLVADTAQALDVLWRALAVADITGLESRLAALETLGIVNLVDGASIATDAATGKHFRVSIAGDRALAAPTNAVDGARRLWEITASSTNRTLTLATGSAGAFELSTGITSPITITAAKALFLGAIYSSARQRWSVIASRETS